MKPAAFLGAVAGGALGAVIWALVACSTGYEIGYVAWALGGMVGFAAVLLGARGQAAGMVCGAIALASIVAGKAMTVSQVLDSSLKKGLYDFLLPQAEAFSKLESERGYAAFMVQHGYTPAQSSQAVGPQELAEFKEKVAPILEDLGRNRPSFDEWRERPAVQAYLHAATADVSILGIVWSGLSPIDIIFALLGVSTAYGLCKRAEERERVGKAQRPLDPKPA